MWKLAAGPSDFAQYASGGAAIAFLIACAGFLRNIFKMNQTVQETVITQLKDQINTMATNHSQEITQLRAEHVQCQRDLGQVKEQMQSMRNALRKAGLDPNGGPLNGGTRTE